MTEALYDIELPGLARVGGGKVRELFRVDDAHLLMVATDRLSAFDVVLPDPIPGKGRILTTLSRFWMEKLAHIVPHHGVDRPLESVLDPATVARLDGRAMLVRALRPLPVEAVVRGHLAGSAWREYRERGTVCGQRLPAGLRLAEALPAPLFTPATKAAQGEHDENIDFDTLVGRIGGERAEAVRAVSLALYRAAADYAAARGLVLADTKFEFGVDEDGRLVLIDEVLTPDSSRYWPADAVRPGENPPSFDKQYVRDHLERSGWNKRPPAPRLPAAVIEGTRARYEEALRRLTEEEAS